MNLFKKYLLSTRPGFFTAAVTPVLIGGALYLYLDIGPFHIYRFILTLIATVLYHAGINVLNDYFDYRNGTDNINKSMLSPFTGGSRMIQQKLMTPGETLAFGLFLMVIGSIIGIYLAYLSGYILLIIGLIGLLSGILYSAPWAFLAGRGLGELTVAINFGLLVVGGAYYVQAGSLSVEIIAASLPTSFLISALLYINQFPDYEADRSSGKRNLVVRLGPARARWGFLFYLIAIYGTLIGAVLLGFMPTLSLVALITLIPFAFATQRLIQHPGGGPELVPAIKGVIISHILTGLITAFSLVI